MYVVLVDPLADFPTAQLDFKTKHNLIQPLTAIIGESTYKHEPGSGKEPEHDPNKRTTTRFSPYVTSHHPGL